MVALGVPELVQGDVEHHEQLETASEGENAMDQFQLERWSAGDVIISIVLVLRELRADIFKVTHWHIGCRLEAKWTKVLLNKSTLDKTDN